MKNILFADGRVGLQICEWLLDNYREDVGLVVATTENGITQAAQDARIPSAIFSTEHDLASAIQQGHEKHFDWGLLLWWPHIVHKCTLALARNGFINTHPSFVPFNRGKHYNFWSLVEQAPFGVSLHIVDDGVDSGDVIAQRQIAYDWEDTGATLYEKAASSMFELFKSTYPEIREGRIVRVPQDLSKGSFHRANELDEASRIDIEASYCARDLFNLLRARTFPGYPACSFREDTGEEFEVRVEIRRKLK